jgi:hypothetical protein
MLRSVLKFKLLRLGLILLIVLVLPGAVIGKREHPEKWYQQKWCEAQKGQVEVVLSDGTRCDCLTDKGERGGEMSLSLGHFAQPPLNSKMLYLIIKIPDS